MNEFEKISLELLDFINDNPSCFHVINSIKKMLKVAGFTELSEQKGWELIPGNNYYVTRNGSSIIAFKVPEQEAENYQIVASHSDSPCFKIKENPELLKERHYISLNVEKYGGMLCSPWFDRPLSVAGRIISQEDYSLKAHLVNIDRDLLMIPSLAIHMDRKANEGHPFQIQKELIPLLGDERAEGAFMDMISEEAGVDRDSILGTDLFLYCRTAPSIWGASNEFISSPRLDDLMCAYSSVKAFIEASNCASINMCCIFDNEEVGSSTKQAADSTFLSDVMSRIAMQLDIDSEQQRILISKSFMLSADNAHAVHPNYPEKADPTNRPYMNGGVVIKHNANQKYTTDAISDSIFRLICKKAGVPVQSYVNHSDIAGGSTLGNISNTHVSLNTIDIGAAQLAMHSPYETAGIKDTKYLYEAIKAFYEANITISSDGSYRI